MYCGILVHNGIKLERILPYRCRIVVWLRFQWISSQTRNKTTFDRSFLEILLNLIGITQQGLVANDDGLGLTHTSTWSPRTYFSRNYPKVSSEDLLEAPKRVQSWIWISAQKVEWAKRDFQWPRVLSDTERSIDSRRKSEKKKYALDEPCMKACTNFWCGRTSLSTCGGQNPKLAT